MIPTQDELIEFIKKKNLVNFSSIARHFNINNATVSDIIADLEKKSIVKVQKLGGSKIVLLKRGK